jgi:hypothetical protein
MVANSYLMSVSAQILNYMFGPCEWLLGVDNPGCFIQPINKLLRLWQLLLKGFYKLPPENSGKALDTEQKHLAIFRGTYLFPLSFEANSPTGNNTMDMRVQAKVLSPCMQDGYHARFCMKLCVRELSYCFPGTGKQKVVKLCRLLKKKAIERVRYSKDNMKVRDRKQILLAVLYPCFPLSILALWTMTVTARVITDTDMATLIAFINMSAQ